MASNSHLQPPCLSVTPCQGSPATEVDSSALRSIDSISGARVSVRLGLHCEEGEALALAEIAGDERLGHGLG